MTTSIDTCRWCGEARHDQGGPCEAFIQDVLSHPAPHPFSRSEARRLWHNRAKAMLETHRTFDDPAVSEALARALGG